MTNPPDPSKPAPAHRTKSTLPSHALLIGLVLPLVACSAIKIPPYSGEISPGARKVEKQGLHLTADPIVDEARSKTYFRTELADRKIAAIYLKAENHSTDATWLLRLQSMTLTDEKGSPGPNAYGKALRSDYGAANAAGMAGAALISLPMIFVSGKLTADAMAKEKNFIDKEGRNQSLSPGKAADGFIYFQLEPNEPWPTGRWLSLECLNLRNQQAVQVQVPLTP